MADTRSTGRVADGGVSAAEAESALPRQRARRRKVQAAQARPGEGATVSRGDGGTCQSGRAVVRCQTATPDARPARGVQEGRGLAMLPRNEGGQRPPFRPSHRLDVRPRPSRLSGCRASDHKEVAAVTAAPACRSATRTVGANRQGQIWPPAHSRVSMTPPTITSAATALPRVIASPKTSQPIMTAKRIEVSRKAATTAMGAMVIAQTLTA